VGGLDWSGVVTNEAFVRAFDGFEHFEHALKRHCWRFIAFTPSPIARGLNSIVYLKRMHLLFALSSFYRCTALCFLD